MTEPSPSAIQIDQAVWNTLPDRRRGVVYVCTGPMYVAAAARSAQSVRRFCPGIPAVLFADVTGPFPYRAEDLAAFDAVHDIADPHRRSKVDYLPHTPFERTLYLDSDTRLRADVSDMFGTLDAFDIALAHAHARTLTRAQTLWRTSLPSAFPQFNGGVIAYRRTEPVLSFLREWRDAYHTSRFNSDQVTLRELIWGSGLLIATLPPEYNVRYVKYFWVWRWKEARPKILHFRRYNHPNVLAMRVGDLRILLQQVRQRFARRVRSRSPGIAPNRPC